MLTLCVMFVCHFVADFLLQSREMGKNKSEKLAVLLKHVGIQGAVLVVPLCFLVGPVSAVSIAVLNSIIHGVIDWYIWKAYKWSVYKRLEGTFRSDATWRYWEDHYFYTTIGFDQLLHGLTLIILAGVFV